MIKKKLKKSDFLNLNQIFLFKLDFLFELIIFNSKKLNFTK